MWAAAPVSDALTGQWIALQYLVVCDSKEANVFVCTVAQKGRFVCPKLYFPELATLICFIFPVLKLKDFHMPDHHHYCGNEATISQPSVLIVLSSPWRK